MRRFFADAQNDIVRAEWDMQRPKYQKNVSRETIPRNPLPFFTRAGSDFQIRTPERASCAQCAPESLPKASTTASVRQNDKEKRNGTCGGLNRENVSRETLPPNPLPFLIRARTDNQIRNPENATTPNARLNLRRRPQNLFCACFSCTNTDRAKLPPCSGSSGLNQKERAGIAPCSGFKTARLPNPAKRSHIKTR